MFRFQLAFIYSVVPLLFTPLATSAADYSTSSTQTTTSSYTTNTNATGVTGSYSTGTNTPGGNGIYTTGNPSLANDYGRSDYGNRGYGYGDRRFGDRYENNRNDTIRDRSPYTETQTGLAPVGHGIFSTQTTTRSGYEASSTRGDNTNRRNDDDSPSYQNSERFRAGSSYQRRFQR